MPYRNIKDIPHEEPSFRTKSLRSARKWFSYRTNWFSYRTKKPICKSK